MDQLSQVLIHSLSPVLLISLSCISFLFFSALLKYFVIISRHHKLFHRCHFITFRILYIMFNFVWTFIYKIYTMFPYGVQIMLSHFEISPIGVYTYYLFFELFLYIIFIVWHYESYHLYCVVRAIFSPCLAMYMTEEHIVSLRYTSSFCLRYPGSIKTHSRYISDRVKSSSSHFLLSPKCTCSTLFFNQFGPFFFNFGLCFLFQLLLPSFI